MLSQIIYALPLLAGVAAGSQHGPRHARHARHVENATRSNSSPVPIFNNAVLQSRADISSKVARSADEFVMEKRNKDGKRVRVMRRKVQTCKLPNGGTSVIGDVHLGQGGASASVTAAPAPSASATDDGSEEAYSSAVASISSVHSASGYPTDWAGPSATSAGASATATYSSVAPSMTASPSSESAAPSASASSGSGSSMLFPVGRGIASWSTEDGMSRKLYPSEACHSPDTFSGRRPKPRGCW
jgi:hypothetical protein